MPTHVAQPVVIPAVGEPPKIIREFAGHVATGMAGVSVARMSSPAGWTEPGQRPEFDEVTVVLEGCLVVEHEGEGAGGGAAGRLEVRAGEAVVAHAGEWVRYSTPEGAEYVAVCVPAFTPGTVHRDA